MNKDERLDYLEDERKKIWDRLMALEAQIKKKTSDYEEDAKLAAADAEFFKESTREAKETAEKDLEEFTQKLQELKLNYDSFTTFFQKLKQNSEASETSSQKLAEILKQGEEQSTKLTALVSDVQKLGDAKPGLEEKIEKLQEIYTRGDDYDTKLSSLSKTANDRRKEIEQLYYEIIGFTGKGEGDEPITNKGLKGELEDAFKILQVRMNESEKSLEKLTQGTSDIYNSFIANRTNDHVELTAKWSSEYARIMTKIETLLPNALTAGLSHAYSEKKTAEETDNAKHRNSFNIAIGGLVAVSLIPFGISIVSLFQDEPLQDVILKVPRIVLAILPLYLPILWVAYSANRKMNLAKRLIEEYSHKEVLSKTFEGLSKPIESIEDKNISADLRVKLLYNILEVNSENPGKLISDYNKSDHPLMDALDKSIKLANAVTKLSKIPGFSKLAATLDKKSKDILQEENLKATAGLGTIENTK